LKNCEYPEAPGPDGCQEPGVWLVQVGTRKTDAQVSCTQHLGGTCASMTEAEYPRKNVPLTVTQAKGGVSVAHSTLGEE
jgi:hypothetical protein